MAYDILTTSGMPREVLASLNRRLDSYIVRTYRALPTLRPPKT